jgi:hypothetical protein
MGTDGWLAGWPGGVGAIDRITHIQIIILRMMSIVYFCDITLPQLYLYQLLWKSLESHNPFFSKKKEHMVLDAKRVGRTQDQHYHRRHYPAAAADPYLVCISMMVDKWAAFCISVTGFSFCRPQ